MKDCVKSRKPCAIFPAADVITQRTLALGVLLHIDAGITSLAPVAPADVPAAASAVVESSDIPFTVSLASGDPEKATPSTYPFEATAVVEAEV